MAYIPIAYQDFSGGWNPDTAPDLLRDNECELFDNIDGYGPIKQRGGVIPLNVTAYDSPITLLLEWNRKDGTTQYIGMKGNSLCYFDQDNDWEASDPIVALDNPNIGYFFFQDKFYFTGLKGGVNRYWVVSGIYQREKLQVIGATATHEGKIILTITSNLYTGTMPTVTIDVTNGETNDAIAVALKAACIAENNISDKFIVEYSGSGSTLYFQTIKSFKSAADLDPNLAISLSYNEVTGISFNSTDSTQSGGVKQKESVRYSGTCTSSGNVVTTITSKLFASPVAITTAILNGDTNDQVATKVRASLNANSSITDNFTVGYNSTSGFYLENKIPLAQDDTFNAVVTLSGGAAGITGVILEPSTRLGAAAGGAVEVIANTDATCDLSPIRKCRCFTWNPKNSRVFASGNPDDVSCLYYSEANDPTFFKATNKVYPTQGEGEINGISNFSTGLVVEFANDLWAWTGYDPGTDATWSRIPITHGSLAHGSVCQTPNSLTMVGVGGLYALSPGALDKDLMLINAAQMSVNLAQNRIVSVLKNAVHIETMKSVFQKTKNKYLLAYGDDSLNSKNNKILVYDFANNSFGRFTGIQADAFCDCANGDVLIASGNWILKMDEGLNDWDIVNGAPKAIPLRFKSKGWDFELPFFLKKIKKTFIASHQFGSVGTTIDFGIRSGYKNLVFPTINTILHEDAELPDAFVWGENWGKLWGWSDIAQKEFKTKIQGTRLQIDISHEVLNEDLLIYGFAFLYKPTKMKGVKYNGVASKNVLS